MGTLDWQTFFEIDNLAEQNLRQDPAQLYGRLTFASRDQYRKVVETTAEAAGQSEMAVAQTAVSLAESFVDTESLASPDTDPWHGLNLPAQAHVGYYLIGSGLAQLEQKLAYQPAGLEPLRRLLKRHPLAFYLGSISLLTVLLVAALLAYAAEAGGAAWQLVLVALVGFVPVTAVAISLINWLVTQGVKPQKLPKLNFADGIPTACQSMVVIPALLTSENETRSLLDQLEQHYLRNPDPHLSFALLTDLADAPQPTCPATMTSFS